jgi:phage tail-like protein
MADFSQLHIPLVRASRFRVTLVRSAGAAEGGDASSAPSTPPSPSPADPPDPPNPLGDGGFQECTGLDIEQAVQLYEEGGRNDGVIQRIGRAKYVNIVLKRGMLFGSTGELNDDLWQWMFAVVSGVRPAPRYDGRIDVYRFTVSDSDIVASWQFFRGLPAKIVGPQFNAKTGEIAIEELHIAHEGLRLVAVPPSE